MSVQHLPERSGVVTFRGTPMTLIGPALGVGDMAPAFTLTESGLAPYSLQEALDAGTRAALLIAVPSLDTPTCSIETATFHRRLGELPASVAVFVVSADLPFAQGRWAEANAAGKLTYLSDYRDHSFGLAYGIQIKELGLLARAVYLVAKDGTIRYAEIVPEIATEPAYDAAIASARALA